MIENRFGAERNILTQELDCAEATIFVPEKKTNCSKFNN